MILIAIGANLPGPDGASPLRTCRAAVTALMVLQGMRFVACSSWYETAPVPPSGQPDYVNGVVRLERQTALTPETLLAALHTIEASHGRRRAAVNDPRTLDLDLIDMDGMVRAGPDPILPHPRAHLRAFVLRPLLDVAPDWVCPAGGGAGSLLLKTMGQSGTRWLAGP